VNDRRAQLLLLQRRCRRIRLIAVCLGASLVCGVVAGVLAPEVLVGGVSLHDAKPEALKPASHESGAPAGPVLLGLSERLNLDPREVRDNLLRWASMSEEKRRQLVAKYWQLTGMEPADRDRIIEQYQSFRKETEARRAFLRDRAERVRDFIGRLSPQDQALLMSMSEEDRAKRLLELWRHDGEW